MKAIEIFKNYKVNFIGNSNIDINSLCYNSQKCSAKSMFFAIKGEKNDGHKFIDNAVENGAITVVVEEDNTKFTKKPELIIKVADTKDALSYASHSFYNKPSEKLKVTGITGTNGKTTITYLLEQIFEKSGVIGTVNYRFLDKTFEAPNTTPMAPEIHNLLKHMYENGVENVFMEVSSHGIELKRVNYIEFDCGIFTNLTHEHLDFHKTMESYYKAKRKFFTEILLRSSKKNKFAVINIDDDYGKKLYNEIKDNIKCLTYAIKNKIANIIPENFKLSLKGTEATIKTPYGTINIKTDLIGEFNLLNTLAAVGVALEFNKPINEIEKKLRKNIVIPGRLERPIKGKNYFVDYAHTPDALKNVLNCLNKVKGRKKIITVFGCGGDRDKEKRPIMGYIAAKYSDFVIVTSDNPRTEDPFLIIDDIIKGINQAIKDNLIKESDFRVIPDRKDAIEMAIKAAKNSDIVLIAGKGHENYQIIGNEKIYFSDVDAIKNCVSSNV